MLAATSAATEDMTLICDMQWYRWRSRRVVWNCCTTRSVGGLLFSIRSLLCTGRCLLLEYGALLALTLLRTLSLAKFL